MSETLQHLPEHAVKPAFELIVANEVHLKIVNERVIVTVIIEKGILENTRLQ